MKVLRDWFLYFFFVFFGTTSIVGESLSASTSGLGLQLTEKKIVIEHSNVQ